MIPSFLPPSGVARCSECDGWGLFIEMVPKTTVPSENHYPIKSTRWRHRLCEGDGGGLGETGPWGGGAGHG